jgi:bifunctional isochorismate lyase/aryl carrier protein
MIPAIAPYPMPTPPANLVGWRPDPARAALLVHDMQRYFVDFFPAGQSPVTELVRNAARLRDVARSLDLPVFYTAQPGAMSREDRGLLLDMWGPGMGADPYGRQILPELAPGPGDTVLTKWRYSAFVRSDLAGRLRAAGRDQLLICGVYAHVGCLMTACDAFSRDIQPFLAADAVADFTPRHHTWALEYAAQRCASVLRTDELCAALNRTTAPTGQS